RVELRGERALAEDLADGLEPVEPPQWGDAERVRWAAVACGLVLALAACGSGQPRTTTKPTVTAPQPPKQDNTVPWPTYGADNARTRSVTAPGVRPPFRRLWTFLG